MSLLLCPVSVSRLCKVNMFEIMPSSFFLEIVYVTLALPILQPSGRATGPDVKVQGLTDSAKKTLSKRQLWNSFTLQNSGFPFSFGIFKFIPFMLAQQRILKDLENNFFTSLWLF